MLLSFFSFSLYVSYGIHMETMLDDFFFLVHGFFVLLFQLFTCFGFFSQLQAFVHTCAGHLYIHFFVAPSWYDYRDLWWLISNLCQTGKPRTRTLHFTFVCFFSLIVVLVAFLTVLSVEYIVYDNWIDL